MKKTKRNNQINQDPSDDIFKLYRIDTYEALINYNLPNKKQINLLNSKHLSL